MKCCVCKIPCEEVWMFGGFMGTEHLKDKEYCEACFKSLSDKLLPREVEDSPPTDSQQIANSA